MTLRQLTVLGATGSIGVNTLEVVARHPDRFKVVALTGHNRIEILAGQCRRFVPDFVVVGDPAVIPSLREMLGSCRPEILAGPEALDMVASLPQVDTVMAAIVGAAGLKPTLAAVRSGKRVLLANKESLVMAGPVFMAEVKRSGATLLPIDSEHNAIFQSLPFNFECNFEKSGVRRILLTASGGPFRTTPLDQLTQVTPDQACAHPTWAMGRKISVDSATLMNKGLEVIEAHWLFGADPARIEVVIHPQSVIHSLVEYIDGSVLAQLGNPDMRTPIANALAYPERIEAGVASLNLFEVAQLTFEAPDRQKFPCLDLAYGALSAGGGAPAVLNAANEVAVAAFLEGRLPYLGIHEVVAEALERVSPAAIESLDDVLAVDAQARQAARQQIERRNH